MNTLEDLTTKYIFFDIAIKSKNDMYMPKKYFKLDIIDEEGNNLGKIKKIIRHKDYSQNFIVVNKKLIRLNRPKEVFDLNTNISYRELEKGYELA